MGIYGICLWHKRKFQPMCHDMGSAWLAMFAMVVFDTLEGCVGILM